MSAITAPPLDLKPLIEGVLLAHEQRLRLLENEPAVVPEEFVAAATAAVERR